MNINVRTATQQICRLELPKIEMSAKAFLREIQEKLVAKGSDRLKKIPFSEMLYGYGWNDEKTVRLGTPTEFGYQSDVYPWAARKIAEENGLESCDSLVPVKIALQWETVKRQLPEQYTSVEWFVHMFKIDNCMTGEMFVPGMGTPNAFFTMNPLSHCVLSVEWVYEGRRSGIAKDQPILFQCK